MNQILITKKLYVTPELKRKKKIYKINFILSIFLVIVLISLYIYAEYDMSKSEQISQEILANIEMPKENKKDTTTIQSDVLIAILNTEEFEEIIIEEEPQIEEQVVTQNNNNKNNNQNTGIYTSPKGYKYTTVATISIPKIGVQYPILLGQTGAEAETEDLLKISPCRFWGPEPNEVGNYCIVGHNYRNSRFFSKVPNLVAGDTFTLTDIAKGRTITYKIYDKYTVDPSDVSCTSQLTNGKKEVTLITCTNDSKQRVIVKAREA